jgi:O-antigen ligase
MPTGNPTRPPLAVLILAATLIGIPWTSGGRSPAGQAALVLLVALAAAAQLLGPAPCRRAGPPALAVIGAVLAGGAAFQTMHPDRTVQALLLAAAYLLAGVLAWRATAVSRRSREVLQGAVIASGLVWTAAGLLRLWRGNDGGLYTALLVGPFDYPNAMAGFLLLTGGAAAAAVPSDGRRTLRVLAGLGALSAGAGVYLTGSRGGALAAVLGLLVWAALRGRLRRPQWIGLGLAGCAVLVWMARSLPRLMDAATAMGLSTGGAPDGSVRWRLSMIEMTWAMIRDHPWLGVGPGAFPVALTHYQRVPYVGGENPHNLYLQVGAEYGVPAAVLLLAVLAIFLARLIRATLRLPDGSPARAQAAALAAALTASFAHAAGDMDWSYPAIAVTVAVMCGLAARYLAAPPHPARARLRLTRAFALAALAALAGAAGVRYTAATLVDWGRIEWEAGRTDAALHRFSQAARFNPFSFAALRGLAWARQAVGDPAAATEAAVQSARLARADPNTHALLAELALAQGRWQAAETHFRTAVELAPAAHLRFHAGLVHSAAARGAHGQALAAYERAVVLFTPDRVGHPEARCLAPGDRYLLARMSRWAAPLYLAAGAAGQATQAQEQGQRLAVPVVEGICSAPRRGAASPEGALLAFWEAVARGSTSEAMALLLPGADRPTDPAHPGAQVTGIVSLVGNERRALLRYEVALPDRHEPRCAHTSLAFSGSGWRLEHLPRLDPHACGP